jgi:hypothetical protein
MAFINEFISENDYKIYKIEDLNHKYRLRNPKPDWTVDHERNIFMRLVDIGREECSNSLTFYFYWKGNEVIVIVSVEGSKLVNEKKWRHYKLVKIKIPEVIKQNEAEILADLRKALACYMVAGVRTELNQEDYKISFDF